MMTYEVPKIEKLSFQPEVQKLLLGFLERPGVSTFLWIGPEGTGKKSYALSLVRNLFCQEGPDCAGCAACRQVLNRTHSDLFWVERPEGKAEIPVEAARELDKKLSNAPLSAPVKVAVIPEADRLNPDAQNALLKNLEEPPDKTLIILMGEKTGNFLPTVLSRCRLIRFPLLAPSTVEKLLMETQGWNKVKAKAASEESMGSLTLAVKSSDPEWVQFREKVTADFDRALSGPEEGWLALGSEYDQWEPDFLGDRELTATQRKGEVLTEAFRAYNVLWEKRVSGKTPVPPKLSTLPAGSILRCLQKHQDMIPRHLGSKMILDHLFLELREGLRKGELLDQSFMELSVQI